LKGTSISPFNVVNFGNVFEQTVCVDWCGNNKCKHWRSCLLALGCDAEAVLCYEKVLTDFKNLKGELQNCNIGICEFSRVPPRNQQASWGEILLWSCTPYLWKARSWVCHPLETSLMGWLTLHPF
jgi:hypothetical protein